MQPLSKDKRIRCYIKEPNKTIWAAENDDRKIGFKTNTTLKKISLEVDSFLYA